MLNLKPIAAALTLLHASPEDPARMEAFLSACKPAIEETVRVFGRSYDEPMRDDLRQELRLRLFLKAPQLATWQARGRLKNAGHYAMTICRNLAFNFSKAKNGAWTAVAEKTRELDTARDMAAPDPIARQELREKLAEAFGRVFVWIGSRWADCTVEQRAALRTLEGLKAGRCPPMAGKSEMGRRNNSIAREVVDVARMAMTGQELPFCPPRPPTAGELRERARAERRQRKWEEKERRAKVRAERRAGKLAQAERIRLWRAEREHRQKEKTA